VSWWLISECQYGLGRVNTNAQSLNNEGQDDEAKEQDIEFVEPAKDPTITFDASKEPFDLVSPAIDYSIQGPGV
jgi:hypothetical protein